MGDRPLAVLFDAGGTLVLQHHTDMGERLAHVIDADQAFDAHYRTMAEFSRLKDAGREASWEWFLEKYFDRLGYPQPAAAGAVIDNGYLLWTWAIPGVAEAIERISAAGIRVAVISNSDGSVERSLDLAGLGGLFEFVLDSEVIGAKKPDPAIFHFACERLGVAPGDAWYVGDSPHHDVAGALAAGLARAWLVDPLDLHHHEDRLRGVPDLPGILGV